MRNAAIALQPVATTGIWAAVVLWETRRRAEYYIISGNVKWNMVGGAGWGAGWLL